MPIASAAAWIDEVLRDRIAANPVRARSIGGVFEFVLDGDGGGTWTLDLNLPQLRPGRAQRMNCRIRASAADFVEVLEGRLEPAEAFGTGRLKVEGNLALSLKLQVLLDPAGWDRIVS